jgi:16S rRNA processing protein RimM
MGRIGAPHGVKGWVKIAPFAASADALAGHRRWWIGGHGEWTETEVAETQVQGARLTARVAGCTDRDAAGRLRGREIAVPRAALPAAGPGEYYWADLVGLEVVNAQGASLGRVTSVFATGANDVLRVGERPRERLLPFVATVIRAVDLAARRIEVDWGLDW